MRWSHLGKKGMLIRAENRACSVFCSWTAKLRLGTIHVANLLELHSSGVPTLADLILRTGLNFEVPQWHFGVAVSNVKKTRQNCHFPHVLQLFSWPCRKRDGTTRRQTGTPTTNCILYRNVTFLRAQYESTRGFVAESSGDLHCRADCGLHMARAKE